MHNLKKLLPRKKRDGAQTTSPTPPVPHAGGLANPLASINQLADPLNPTERSLSASPIGRAARGGNEYEPSHLNPSTLAIASPLESQPVPDISIHGPQSVRHVSSAVQDSNESVPPHLDLAAPGTVAPYNNRLNQDASNRPPLRIPQTNSALQGVSDTVSLHSNLGIPRASSPNSRSAPDNAIHRLQSPTPTTTTLQGTTSAPDQPTQTSTQPSGVKRVFTVGKAMLKTLGVVAGVPTLEDFVELLEQSCSTKKNLEKYCGHPLDSIESLLGEEGSKMQPKLKNSLNGLYSELLEISEEMRNGEDVEAFIELISLKVTQTIDSFLLVTNIAGVITMADFFDKVEKHTLSQSIKDLPRVEASYDDYACKKQSGPCFGRTRERLLSDVGQWITTGDRSQLYLLSGLAGIGKSTVAFTVADRAKKAGYLGASFFFSRDEAERSNAKKFFTTIAFQLCVYDKEFAQAIESVLQDEQGIAATTKVPREQLEVLILNPLRDIIRLRPRPVVVVVDALDECEDRDAMEVLAALTKLVQELPPFRVVLTTRPQPHLPTDASAHRVFHLQDIEEKIVDDDVRLYLEYSLSQEGVARCLPGLPEQWSASSQEITFLVRTAGRLFIVASTAVRFILDEITCDPRSQMEALKTDGRISLGDLASFYLVILRHAVPSKCKPIVVQRFKAVVGAILAIQMPLAFRHRTSARSCSVNPKGFVS